MRTVYLGTSDFAARVLRRLADSPHRPSLVVAPPDRPRGRGRKLASPPAAEAAAELGIELLQAANVNEAEVVEAIRKHDPELPVLCAFGQLIGAELLAGPPMLNIHPSLLPRWRGAAPIERAMLAGDNDTGVTIMRVEEGLDSGPIALQEKVAIEPREDSGSLSRRLADLGGELVVRALDSAASGELEFTPQDDGAATYAEKLTAADRLLDPSRPAPALERQVLALTPHIGAQLPVAGGEPLGVAAGTAVDEPVEQGELRAEGGALLLGCSEGALRLQRVKPAGKREMDAAEFLRGHEIPRLAD